MPLGASRRHSVLNSADYRNLTMYDWKSYSESAPADNQHEPSASGSAVFGPPLLSVAWIPYYANVEEIEQPTAVTNPKWKDAFRLLLSTSNSAPPFRFAGRSDVRGFLAAKNFRAALGLCDVKLESDRSGSPVRISLSFLQEVGYTAIRDATLDVFGVMAGPMSKNPVVRKYVRGKKVADEHPKVVWNRDDNFVDIVHEIKFRISGPLALAVKLKVHEWPAYAWMRNTYRIYASDSVSIWSAGSFIPNECSFVDWKPSGDHSMMKETESEFDTFLFAGANAEPLGRFTGREHPMHQPNLADKRIMVLQMLAIRLLSFTGEQVMGVESRFVTQVQAKLDGGYYIDIPQIGRRRVEVRKFEEENDGDIELLTVEFQMCSGSA